MDLSEKVRGVRNMLGLSMDEFGEHCNISKSSLVKIEQGELPSLKIMGRIERFIEQKGYRFTKYGVEKYVEPFKAVENYMDVLEDAISVMSAGDEILFNRADDRRSSPEVVGKLNEMRALGLKFRSTIHEDNSFIWGEKSEYRHMNKKDFANSEVQVVYADRFVIHVPADAEVGDKEHFIIIKNKQLARVQRDQFENDWRRGKCLP